MLRGTKQVWSLIVFQFLKSEAPLYSTLNTSKRLKVFNTVEKKNSFKVDTDQYIKK